jgi:hypothetical protein
VSYVATLGIWFLKYKYDYYKGKEADSGTNTGDVSPVLQEKHKKELDEIFIQIEASTPTIVLGTSKEKIIEILEKRDQLISTITGLNQTIAQKDNEINDLKAKYNI